MTSYIFPCALIDSATSMRLADPLTTDAARKWAIPGSNISAQFNYMMYKNSRRSLKISHNTGSYEYLQKGLTGSDIDYAYFNNPYGSSIGDISWATNCVTWIHSDANSESVDYRARLSNGIGGNVDVDYTNAYQVDNAWAPLDGSADFSSLTNLRQAKLGINGGNVAGVSYFDSMALVNKVCSNLRCESVFDVGSYNNPSYEYNWHNGLGFVLTSLTPTAIAYSISGYYAGEDYREVMEQLRAVESLGLKSHEMLQSPLPKFTNVLDYAQIKTYLFVHQPHSYQETPDTYVLYAEPIVITNMSVSRDRQKTKQINFNATFTKFSGI